jgi:hypothetical protein
MSKVIKTLAIPTTAFAAAIMFAATAATPALAQYVGYSEVDNAAGPAFAHSYIPPQRSYYGLSPNSPALTSLRIL